MRTLAETRQFFFDRTTLRTIEEARQFILDGREEPNGVICPVCKLRVAVRRRPLNYALARALIDLVDQYVVSRPRRWIHTGELVVIQNRAAGGDFAKLRHFGLIRPRPRDPETGRKYDGYWKPTREGYRFVVGEIRVPSAVYLHNTKCLGIDKETISIREALGKHFDLDEVMAGTRGLGVRF